MRKLRINSLVVIFVNLILSSCLFGENVFDKQMLRKNKAEDFFSDKAVIKLVKSAEKGNLKGIDEALKEGADINAKGKGGYTPLLWAFTKFNKKGFEYLLQKGADPNYIDEKGYSIMYFVTLYDDPFYLEKALEYGGNPDTLVPGKLNESLIFRTIGNNPNIENLRLLINAGANLNHQDIDGQTPMIYAATFNCYDMIYILLEAGADPLLKDVTGSTILWNIEKKNINTHHPIYKWYKKVVELLRSRGIEVNVKL